MRLNEEQKERLRNLTVEVLLDVRGAYLKTPGCNVLKHYDQIQDRMRAAARQASSPEEWVTTMTRTLQLSSPTTATSHSFRDLADAVREMRAAREWLDLVEVEFGYLMAVARGAAEKRKEEAQRHA